MPRKAVAKGAKVEGTIVPVFLNSPDEQAHFGQRVTFNVTAKADRPWVRTEISQAGSLVHEARYGVFPEYPFPQFVTLGPTHYWPSGEADCVARLELHEEGVWREIAACHFHIFDP